MSSPHAAINWDRDRPSPETPGITMRMTWKNLLFLHWRIDPAEMKAVLPDELEVDTFDGSAWIGLVPFQMDRTRPFGIPGIPTIYRFFECNVRTYVLHKGVPGVWFFSLDAASRLAVFGGKNFWKLNYVYANFNVDVNGANIDYQLRRPNGPGTKMNWTVGDELPKSEPGSLRHFLTERYYLYASHGKRLWRGGVFHKPWTLRTAQLNELDDELISDTGLMAEGAPACMAADDVDVLGWSLKRVN